jgi:hypothetical protein
MPAQLFETSILTVLESPRVGQHEAAVTQQQDGGRESGALRAADPYP